MQFRSISLLVVLLSLSIRPCFCQTVGNGTVFAPPAGAREGYGINSGELGGVSAFPSRHNRGGNGSGIGGGIGGSFIGTTSPTSEGSPAISRPTFIPDTVQRFRLPKLDSVSFQTVDSPALQMFSPALPSMVRSSALTDPLANPFGRANTFQPIESLPSFNKRRSVTDLMQF